MTLYADDAVLWGTLSPTVRSNREALLDYFVNAFKVLPNLKVAFGDQLIRVYGNAAINTGYYTFSYDKDGEQKGEDDEKPDHAAPLSRVRARYRKNGAPMSAIVTPTGKLWLPNTSRPAVSETTTNSAPPSAEKGITQR